MEFLDYLKQTLRSNIHITYLDRLVMESLVICHILPSFVKKFRDNIALMLELLVHTCRIPTIFRKLKQEGPLEIFNAKNP